MIRASIPASLPLKQSLIITHGETSINPIADTAVTATYQGADVDWYIKADRADKGF